MSQGTGPRGLSRPLASSLLLHLGVLAAALVLSLPRAALPPAATLTLDLSRLNLRTEGGGSAGAGPQATPTPAPAPAGPPAVAPARPTPVQPALRPATPAPERPAEAPRPPQPDSSALAEESSPAPTGPAASPSPGPAGGGGSTANGAGNLPCPWLRAIYGGGDGPGSGDGLGPGVGSGLSGLPRDYLAALHAEIERYKVYPLTARRRGWEGEVRVRFLVERDGTVSDVEILSSSGFSVLDEAAAATLQRIRRLPPLPSTLRLSRLRLELPMVYRLTR